MNTIKANTPTPARTYSDGSIWRDNGTGDFYILAQTASNKYQAICLKDGNRWDDDRRSAKDAVKDLVFVGADATISLDFA